jgi:methionyl aminopeptidase
MISIKSQREIDIMKEAGRIVALCHQELKNKIVSGVSLLELNNLVEDIIISNNAIPTFKGYDGFPCAICVALNDCVIHGIPNDDKLKEGDIISIDIGVTYRGYVGDSAWSYAVGDVSKDAMFLLEETEKSLFEGLSEIREGVHLSNISNAIGEYAKSKNLGIIREFAGHGVGTSIHEEPQILNYGKRNKGPILKAGMTLAIEPMLTLKGEEIYMDEDGWSIYTKDQSLACHFEHTILVTKDGYEILTKI